MLLISVPVNAITALSNDGTAVKINGHATTLRRDGEYLHYLDEDGIENSCLIIDEHEHGDLVRFTAASHGCESMPHSVVHQETLTVSNKLIERGSSPQKTLEVSPTAESERKWFWIAVNGPSVALMPVAASAVMAHPIPEQLIGFPTLEEAKKAQNYLLTAPIKKVKSKMKTWTKKINAREMAYCRPSNPEPPTRDTTAWSV